MGALHGTQFLFEVFDFVAQARRNLELEVLGGGHHLGRQLFDEVRELGLGSRTGGRGAPGTDGAFGAFTSALFLAVAAL